MHRGVFIGGHHRGRVYYVSSDIIITITTKRCLLLYALVNEVNELRSLSQECSDAFKSANDMLDTLAFYRP